MILKSEGDTPDRYKISKQPDVVMLFYLLPEKTIHNICKNAGYAIPETEKIIRYYYQRTTHGSTLSHIVFGAVLHKYDAKKSRTEYFQALRSDIEDSQHGTTAEGIHLGVMAGTVNFHIYQHAGIEPLAHILTLNPYLNSASYLDFRLQFRSHWYHITITKDDMRICLEEEHGTSVSICIYGQIFSLFPGKDFCQKLKRVFSS